MHFDWNQIISLATLVIGTFLGHRIIKPRDHDRAAHLDQIAAGAAALVVSLFPGAAWAVLLENVVKQIAAAAGVPTRNVMALNRAAAAALTNLGVKPPTA
jgi:hypothetical protein